MAPANPKDRVLEILARKTGLNPAQINLDARLPQDLKIDGDDAADAIWEISTTCDVDVSGFDCSRYFRSEPSLLSFLWFLPSQKRDRASNKASLTVKDLLDAVVKGRLGRLS